jgi:hypothetical protein
MRLGDLPSGETETGFGGEAPNSCNAKFRQRGIAAGERGVCFVESTSAEEKRMRHLATIFGFTAATMSVFLPGPIYADDPPAETFYMDGTVDDVSFHGEIAKDTTAKKGWTITVTYKNDSDKDETCPIDTELMRSVINPQERGGSPGLAVWHHKDKVSVPAHGTLVKTYELPSWIGEALTANARAELARQKESEKENPNYALLSKPYNVYSVGFQKTA